MQLSPLCHVLILQFLILSNAGYGMRFFNGPHSDDRAVGAVQKLINPKPQALSYYKTHLPEAYCSEGEDSYCNSDIYLLRWKKKPPTVVPEIHKLGQADGKAITGLVYRECGRDGQKKEGGQCPATWMVLLQEEKPGRFIPIYLRRLQGYELQAGWAPLVRKGGMEVVAELDAPSNRHEPVAVSVICFSAEGLTLLLPATFDEVAEKVVTDQRFNSPRLSTDLTTMTVAGNKADYYFDVELTSMSAVLSLDHRESDAYKTAQETHKRLNELLQKLLLELPARRAERLRQGQALWADYATNSGALSTTWSLEDAALETLSKRMDDRHEFLEDFLPSRHKPTRYNEKPPALVITEDLWQWTAPGIATSMVAGSIYDRDTSAPQNEVKLYLSHSPFYHKPETDQVILHPFEGQFNVGN